VKILLYFDWDGSRKELKAHDEKMKKAAEETKVEYLGLYGSMTEKWNYVWLFDTDSYDRFIEMAIKVPRPNQLKHYIIEGLYPQKF
jgi:hypothetical protein